MLKLKTLLFTITKNNDQHYCRPGRILISVIASQYIPGEYSTSKLGACSNFMGEGEAGKSQKMGFQMSGEYPTTSLAFDTSIVIAAYSNYFYLFQIISELQIISTFLNQ